MQKDTDTTQSSHYSDDIVWDASNIGENYPGITAPLTYSFIRGAYANVYQNFLRLLGVSEKNIQDRQEIFHNMLGYILGHVYYNIANWYQLLTFLPFFSKNKEFFDTMLSPAKKNTSKKKPRKKANLLVTISFVTKILWPYRLFHKFDKGYKKNVTAFSELDFSILDSYTLIQKFERFKHTFFSLWAYTIVNDFRVMVFFGILTKLAKKWLPEPDDYLHSIITADSLPESIKPLQLLNNLAQEISSHSRLKTLFAQENDEKILHNLKHASENPEKSCYEKIEYYLNLYGNRSANELKLEEPKFIENPENIITLVKKYIAHDQPLDYNKMQSHTPLSQPSLSLLKRFILQKLATITAKGVYKREEYRVKRGFVFGLARSVFLEIGSRFQRSQFIENKEDIFYLYQEEIYNIIRFHTLPFEISRTIQTRKRELTEYKKLSLPIRLKTHGFTPNTAVFTTDISSSSKNTLQGKVTSLGESITAQVVVMTEFTVKEDVQGKILVAPKTDPGWTVIFPLLKGIITEKGNTLSHASIIARELKIPCIVQIENATHLLNTGDTITLDPKTGQVHIIKKYETP